MFVSELGEGGYNNVLCDEDQEKELQSTSLVDCGLKCDLWCYCNFFFCICYNL